MAVSAARYQRLIWAIGPMGYYMVLAYFPGSSNRLPFFVAQIAVILFLPFANDRSPFAFPHRAMVAMLAIAVVEWLAGRGLEVRVLAFALALAVQMNVIHRIRRGDPPFDPITEQAHSQADSPT